MPWDLRISQSQLYLWGATFVINNLVDQQIEERNNFTAKALLIQARQMFFWNSNFV